MAAALRSTLARIVSAAGLALGLVGEIRCSSVARCLGRGGRLGGLEAGLERSGWVPGDNRCWLGWLRWFGMSSALPAASCLSC